MNYSRLAKESSKIFEAFRQEGWNDEWAYELSKICIREYPIFREMIEEEKAPDQIIGYVYYMNGSKEPFYKREMYNDMGGTVIYTKTNMYRISDELVDDPMHFSPIYRTVYYARDDNGTWYQLRTIDHVEFI